MGSSQNVRNPPIEKKITPTDSFYYRKKYFELLEQKERAFITEDKDCAVDGDDSYDELLVNLALMAKGDEDSNVTSSGWVKTTNTFNLTNIECKKIINDTSNEIYNLGVSLKS